MPELAQTRRHLDEQRSAEGRLHFWVMTNYLASDAGELLLPGDRHAPAMGVRELPVIDWDRAVAPDIAIELRIEESVRRQRLAARAAPGRAGYWSAGEESNIAAVRRLYDDFDLTALDTTGMSPAEVVASAARPPQTIGAKRRALGGTDRPQGGRSKRCVTIELL